LDRSLFRPADPEALRFKGREGLVVLLLFLALAMALQLLRASYSTDTLWAEDGAVFLGGSLTHGFFDAVTSTYAEYLVVGPRLIGELGALVPLRDAPLAMNLTAVLFGALCGVAVWCASASHIRTTYLRALLVALAVLPPVSGLETVASTANIAWYGGLAVFWLLLWRPSSDWSACLAGGLILITGLSSPVTFFLVPLAALRAVAIRDRRDTVIAGAFGLALAIQLPATLFSGEDLGGSVWTSNILVTFLQRVPLGAVLGLEWGGSAWEDWGWPFLIGICIAVAAYLAVLAARATSGRLLAGIAVLTAIVTFVVSGYRRNLGDTMVWPVDFHHGLGARYAVVPTLLLLSALLVLVDSVSRGRRGAWRWAAPVTAAVLLVPLVTSFYTGHGRRMPAWDHSLTRASEICRKSGAPEVVVFIAPEGFSMSVPCERLKSE
jgi:hypothetical protein